MAVVHLRNSPIRKCYYLSSLCGRGIWGRSLYLVQGHKRRKWWAVIQPWASLCKAAPLNHCAVWHSFISHGSCKFLTLVPLPSLCCGLWLDSWLALTGGCTPLYSKLWNYMFSGGDPMCPKLGTAVDTKTISQVSCMEAGGLSPMAVPLWQSPCQSWSVI